MDFRSTGQAMYTLIKQLWMLKGMSRMDDKKWPGFFFFSSYCDLEVLFPEAE